MKIFAGEAFFAVFKQIADVSIKQNVMTLELLLEMEQNCPRFRGQIWQ